MRTFSLSNRVNHSYNLKMVISGEEIYEVYNQYFNKIIFFNKKTMFELIKKVKEITQSI